MGGLSHGIASNVCDCLQPEINEEYVRRFVQNVLFQAEGTEATEQETDENEHMADLHRAKLSASVYQVCHLCCLWLPIGDDRHKLYLFMVDTALIILKAATPFG